MKKITTYTLFCFVCLLCYSKQSIAQAKLVLNGGIINITNACNIVLENDSSNAIIRYTGSIISEGEENMIMWHIKETVGTYTIPFGTTTGEYIPVSFEKKAGVGNGYFNFSTYPTEWENSAMLPQGVNNLINPGVDNSDIIIDRFWQIDARTYTTKPSLINLKLTYANDELIDTNNRIVESNLKAIRWNTKNSTWNDYFPAGQIDSITNSYSVDEVADTNFYKWWTLVSKINSSYTLPITLLDFKAECDYGKTKIIWSTASEKNNQFFTIESSVDGFKWEEIAIIESDKTTDVKKDYSYLDNSINSKLTYYKLKQTDINGNFTYSEIIKNTCDIEEENNLQVYPNPSTGVLNFNKDLSGKILTVQNNIGQIVMSQSFSENNYQANLSELTDGLYVLNIGGETKKIIIKK